MPGGYLGTIPEIDTDGRTARLAPAGLGDVFSHYIAAGTYESDPVAMDEVTYDDDDVPPAPEPTDEPTTTPTTEPTEPPTEGPVPTRVRGPRKDPGTSLREPQPSVTEQRTPTRRTSAARAVATRGRRLRGRRARPVGAASGPVSLPQPPGPAGALTGSAWAYRYEEPRVPFL